MESEYKIFTFEKIKRAHLIWALVYFTLNILPLFFLNVDILSIYLIIIPITSLTIFMFSDFLKSTRNFNLYLLWLISYILIYLIQQKNFATIFNVQDTSTEIMFKSIRLPLIGIIYSQIFRILFVSKYGYEPSVYDKTDRIGAKIFSKKTKNKEDYIWFFVGRFIMFFLITYLNFSL